MFDFFKPILLDKAFQGVVIIYIYEICSNLLNYFRDFYGSNPYNWILGSLYKYSIQIILIFKNRIGLSCI